MHLARLAGALSNLLLLLELFDWYINRTRRQVCAVLDGKLAGRCIVIGEKKVTARYHAWLEAKFF